MAYECVTNRNRGIIPLTAWVCNWLALGKERLIPCLSSQKDMRKEEGVRKEERAKERLIKEYETKSQAATSYYNHHGNNKEGNGSCLPHGKDSASFRSQLLIREQTWWLYWEHTVASTYSESCEHVKYNNKNRTWYRPLRVVLAQVSENASDGATEPTLSILTDSWLLLQKVKRKHLINIEEWI